MPFEHIFGHTDYDRNGDFRSMAIGRPLGTFEDPARRARAWHWLSVVQALAGVEKARHLDRLNGPLSRGLVQKPRFDQIRQDGYDPGGVCAYGRVSLVDHVARKRGRFNATKGVYEHPFWKHLEMWEPPWPERAGWIAAQLRRHRIVRYTPEDEDSGFELGLLRKPGWGLYECAPSPLPPLNLDEKRFADLDGLLLLLVLCREAQDAAHLDRVERLQGALHRAASLFAKQHNYRDEVDDTWKVLIGARMVAWHPHLAPTETELLEAKRDFVEPDPIFPSLRTLPRRRLHKAGTRSARRLRRQIWVRACRLHLERGSRNPAFEYRDATAAYEWLITHRDQIRQRQILAINRVLGDRPYAELERLPPLVMPKGLYDSRRPPVLTEEEAQGAYADASFYTIIPVVPESR
ncbi:MAG TPA: hypothetical protein VF292_00395 [Rhodanobacteraceae bacterium]